MEHKSKLFLQIANLGFVIITIIVNSLANIIPINGNYTGELADLYPNLFVPTGLTFSIWGVIYVLLIMFGIYQIRDIFKKEKINMPYVEKIGLFFILASLGNISWIYLWHYEKVGLSLIAILVLFFSLLMIYQRLEIGLKKTEKMDKIFVYLPFSVYFGWITVATIANITAFLVDINWDGFGISQVAWTILILVTVVLITIIVLIKRKDIAYSLVIIWALFGIYLKRVEPDTIFGVQKEIAYASILGIIAILLAIIVLILYRYSVFDKKSTEK